MGELCGDRGGSQASPDDLGMVDIRPALHDGRPGVVDVAAVVAQHRVAQVHVISQEIAARLELSPKTVDTYRASLMRKLDIHDVAGLVKFAIHRDLISSR